MSWLDTLSDLWNTPATDFSDPMTQDWISNSEAQDILDTALTENISFTNDALHEATALQAAEAAGINAVYLGQDKIQDLEGKQYTILTVNGVTQATIINSQLVFTTPGNNKVESVVFDVTDQEDYNNRYVSIDSPLRRHDSRDIAFFRIVTNDANHTTIFPNFRGDYPQPGITSNKFKQFILLQLGEASRERMQIVETNQDFQVLFFNKKPEFLTLSGILKNTIDNPWTVNMVFLWDNLMRGTKLVENGWILQFYVDGQLYYGYPFEFQRSKIAPNDFSVQFSLTLIVTDKINLYNTDSTLSQQATTVITS
jgi:hypothetical protein